MSQVVILEYIYWERHIKICVQKTHIQTETTPKMTGSFLRQVIILIHVQYIHFKVPVCVVVTPSQFHSYLFIYFSTQSDDFGSYNLSVWFIQCRSIVLWVQDLYKLVTCPKGLSFILLLHIYSLVHLVD